MAKKRKLINEAQAIVDGGVLADPCFAPLHKAVRQLVGLLVAAVRDGDAHGLSYYLEEKRFMEEDAEADRLEAQLLAKVAKRKQKKKGGVIF